MVKRLFILAIVAGILGFGGFWVLTMPTQLTDADLPNHTPDLKNGERMFWAGGCASCHAAPSAKGDAKLLLTGGVPLKSAFGTFIAPNLSPDLKVGIGGWSTLDFVNAMKYGVAPDGSHYYPAFPYTSYQYMRLEDMIDLKAFLDTLAPVTEAAPDHQVGFPFTLRRGLGLWKLLYLDGKPLPADPNANAQVARGQYLVQGPGHCSACHTPRDQFGGLLEARFLAGNPGVTLDGKKEGAAPNITPHASGIGSWSAGEIAYSLESGFDPSYDTFGGEMVALQENMAKLPAADREAIAAYLKSIPALPSETTNQP